MEIVHAVALFTPRGRAVSRRYLDCTWQVASVNSHYLFQLACRCIDASRECSDHRAKEAFRDIAEDLIRKANELDGVKALVATSKH